MTTENDNATESPTDELTTESNNTTESPTDELSTENNNATESPTDELTTADGRKIVSFAASGESYSIETTEQAARGKSAELETEMQEIKLRAMKRGIRHIRL